MVRTNSLQTGKKAPRVLIATLFLPETVSFEDPATHELHQHPQEPYIEHGDDESHEYTPRNFGLAIDTTAAGQSPNAEATRIGEQDQQDKVAFPSFHAQKQTGEDVVQSPSENAPPALAVKNLSPIQSAPSSEKQSPTVVRSSTSPPLPTTSAFLSASARASGTSSAASGSSSSNNTSYNEGIRVLSQSTSSLPVPTGSVLAEERASFRLSRMPSTQQRSASILQDLQIKGTGLPLVLPAKGAVTPGTAGDLELGTNPFENASLTSIMSSPAPPTPSLQSSIASSRRPTAVRLANDGGRDSPSQTALNQVLRERLERLQLSGGGGASKRSGGSALDDSVSSTGQRYTGSSLGPGRTRSQGDDSNSATRGSYFNSTAGTPSATVVRGSETPSSNTSSHQRRSSSSARHCPPVSIERPGASRAFSRARRTTETRRRSSSSIDASSALSPPGSAHSHATIGPAGALEEHTGPPTFSFEHNPHGNGGLQNAIRSVHNNRDSKLRTASEPTRSTLTPDATSTVRGQAAQAHPVTSRSQVSGTRAIMDEHIWIGTPGCSIAEFDEPLRSTIEKRYLIQRKSAVVWLEDDILEPAYDMFCKQILWPTFHYQVLDAHKSKAYESPSWLDYKAMNQAFADKIVAMYRPGDLIWVNDYHLLLVPRMVRDKLPNATIGFFLHINFPSSEIFRCLPVRQELLLGMLGADLVGFQTYNLARHFRQTCQRLLSVEATPKGIQLPTGFSRVGVFSIGIDVKALNERKKEAEVAEWLATLRERYAGFKVLIARDKLDEIKGVRKKLEAYECFLEKYPHWQGKVVLIQVAMATTLENEKQGEVMDVVSRINTKYSTFTYQPVVFLHQDVSFSQYLALLEVADCFINASLREGMNLTSHEFVICQEGHWAPLILSEFTGSYSKAGFHRSIAINPYDKLSFAKAINEALIMPEQERISRWQDLERHVWGQTAQHWCTSFIESLSKGAVDVLNRPHTSPRLAGVAGQSPDFDVVSALVPYRASSKRLLLIDLEGTLLPNTPKISHGFKHHLAEKIAHALDNLDTQLTQLASDPTNTVYIMSGAPPSEIDGLARRYPKLGWIVENGCFVSLPERSATVMLEKRQWHKLVSGTHDSWREPVLEILRYYTERTPGSVIDDRGISIVWRYANTTEDAHPHGLQLAGASHNDEHSNEMPVYKDGTGNEAYHWARRQAAEVQNHIMDSLGERFGIQLYPGATSFLILPRKAGRAVAVAHILQSDDTPDEDLDDGPSEDRSLLQHETTGGEDPEGGHERDIPAEPIDSAQRLEDRLHSEVSKAGASHQLLEQYDYVLAMTEDQRLCDWLEEMALDKIVTVSVGDKRRGTRWRISNPDQVQHVLAALAALAAASADA